MSGARPSAASVFHEGEQVCGLPYVGMLALWERNIGAAFDRDSWIEQQSRSRKLKEQTVDLARRLEAAGVRCQDDSEPVALISLCTGEAVQLPRWRRLQILPLIQQDAARGMQKSLRAYCGTRKANRLRMWVFSAGYVPLERYGEAHGDLTRFVSRLAASETLADAGIEVIYTRIEFVVHRLEDGRVMLHLHAHVLVESGKGLGKQRWTELCDAIRQRAPRGYFHDAGKVRDLAELVKYCTKPEDLVGLHDWELLTLAAQTFRRRFMIPLGGFRDWRRTLDEQGMKLCSVQTARGADGWKPAVTCRTGNGGARYSVGTGGAENIVLGFTSPAPLTAPRAQVYAIVMNPKGSIHEICEQRRLLPLLEKARGFYEARIAAEASSIKDTGRLIVRAPGAATAPRPRSGSSPPARTAPGPSP